MRPAYLTNPQPDPEPCVFAPRAWARALPEDPPWPLAVVDLAMETEWISVRVGRMGSASMGADV